MIGASRAASTRAYQVLSTTNITSTGSQNYTVPEGTVYVEIEMFGGGGGSGDGGTTSSRGVTLHIRGGGGGGGAYVKHRIFNTSVIKDAVINFTVGQGGVRHGSGTGTAGGDTTLNSITPDGGSAVDLSGPSAGGGGPGTGINAVSEPTNAHDGGVASGGNITNTNAPSNPSSGAAQLKRQQGTAYDGGDGGDSPNGGSGGNGGNASGSGTGNAGFAPGGGAGGGASENATAGSVEGNSGADGKVIVKAFG